MAFRRVLTFFDVTNITVGAIIGADIYVASALTAGMLGPASLIAWALAGVLATILALTLGECARIVPQVGGPYAYVSQAFGRLPGFLTGWSMWIAEVCALPVFAIAFTNYLGYFVTIGRIETHLVRIAFLAALTAANVASVRAAGRLNDVLTALKLAPLLALVGWGTVYATQHADEVLGRLTPFAPFGLDQLPSALVLIVWAYMGFELCTVPAGEVEAPQRTIPRALAAGMAIVTVFYLSTNFVVYALIGYPELAGNATPLVAAATVVFGLPGAAMMAIGAMVSVSGSDDSDMIGSSRLGFAMAADGLLPHALAVVHPRFRTPHVALITQSVFAIALSFIDQLARLISFAVANLSFAFLLCAIALLRLHSRESARLSRWQRALPFLGGVVATTLLVATSTTDKEAGAAVLAIGVLVYVAAASGETAPSGLLWLTDRDRVLARLAHGRMRFLGGLVGWLGGRRTPARPPRPERHE